MVGVIQVSVRARKSRDCRVAKPEMNSVLRVADWQFHRPPATRCGAGGIGKRSRVAEMLRTYARFVVSPIGYTDRNGEAAHFRIKSPSNVGRI